MSITMNIYYKGKGTDAKDFANEMIESGLVAAIREKKGNLRYEYFMPLEDESTVLLIDRWESQESLDEHHHSKTMQKIMELRAKYELTMKVERYIDDMENMPESDKKFIVEQS